MDQLNIFTRPFNQINRPMKAIDSKKGLTTD